jgi:hypothetical protein
MPPLQHMATHNQQVQAAETKPLPRLRRIRRDQGPSNLPISAELEGENMESTKLDAIKALATLRGFIGKSQLSAVGDCCRGEEKQFFFDKMVELAGIVESMPKTYEQEGLGDQAVAHLHYFTSGCDWYITEKDMEREQHQAYGSANIGYGAERGYISIVDLLQVGAELDLYFKPKTLAELAKKDEEKHDRV